MSTIVRRLYDLPGGRFTPDDRVIALTFDDGPGPYTTQIAETLTDLDVPATFFVVGSQAARSPEIVASLAAGNHTVAGHSWSHRRTGELDDDEVISESERTAELVARLTGHPAPYVRPPYGNDAGRFAAILEPHGLTTVTWSVAVRDWARAEALEIVELVLEGLHPGAIVILHDGGGDRSATADAVPLIAAGARVAGYELVAL